MSILLNNSCFVFINKTLYDIIFREEIVFLIILQFLTKQKFNLFMFILNYIFIIV